MPHALSLARVGLVLVTYNVVLAHNKPLFAVMVLLCVLTDMLDGPLARAYGKPTRLGANVDSAADLAFYISLPVWTFIFDRSIVMDNLALIVMISAMYVIANFVSQLVFGALGVHNRLSRLSGTIGVVTTFYAILWGMNPILFWGILLVLSADLVQRYAAIFGKWIRDARANDT